MEHYLKRTIRYRNTRGTGKSGHIMLASSFLRFNKSYSYDVVNTLSQQTGYVGTFHETMQRHAAQLVAVACSEAQIPAALQLLLSELNATDRFDVAYPLCRALIRFANQENGRDISDAVSKLLRNATSTKLFDGPVKDLAVKLVEMGNGKQSEWHTRAQSIVTEYMNNDSERTVLMNFMADLGIASL